MKYCKGTYYLGKLYLCESPDNPMEEKYFLDRWFNKLKTCVWCREGGPISKKESTAAFTGYNKIPHEESLVCLTCNTPDECPTDGEFAAETNVRCHKW